MITPSPHNVYTMVTLSPHNVTLFALSPEKDYVHLFLNVLALVTPISSDRQIDDRYSFRPMASPALDK